MKRSPLVDGRGSSPSGLGQTTRTVKVGTFGSARISSGSREYSFTVEENGSIEPGPEFNENHDAIDGNVAKGKIFSPGGYDGYRVTGSIVSADLPDELSFESAGIEEPRLDGSGGSGGGGSTGGDSSGGGSNGGGSSGGGSNGGSSSGGSSGGGSGGGAPSGGGMVKTGQGQQAGMSTSTVLLGVGAIAAVGIGIVALSE